MIKSFKDLYAWQKSHKLVINIYDLSRQLNQSREFIISNQILRAAISITSNIAEGFGRRTYKEKVHFYYIARGSITEVHNQILILKDTDQIPNKHSEALVAMTIEAQKVLQGLINKTKLLK